MPDIYHSFTLTLCTLPVKTAFFFCLPLIVSFHYGIIRPVFLSVQENGMLLEDLKQQLVDVNGRLETLRRHL